MSYSLPKITFSLFIFFGGSIYAQQLLTVADAVEIALENNYGIKLAQNNLRIDQNNLTWGNAGILPRVEANIVDNNSIQDLSQVRSDGSIVENSNAKNNSLNYGVRMDWTLFNGFGMFARYDQLKQLEVLGETQLKQTILDRVSNTMVTYYELVQQKQEIAAMDSTLMISQQRVELAENRFTIGKASKLEVLNAQVDINTDKTLYARLMERYAHTKIRLNEILARDPKTDFTVAEFMLVDESLSLPTLETLAKEQNPDLQAQLINNRIAELELKRVRAARYPTIVGTTGYNFSESESSLGFTTSSSAQGFNYGISASVNIFDGFNQKRNEQVAKIQLENAEIAVKQQVQTLQSQLEIAYQTYLTNVSLIVVEENNEAIARENMDITVEKFRIGTISTLEFRTAQQNYINAKVRFSEATYQAKLSEIMLKQLAGNLTL
ncbi:MAG TPA: TolC family protein [Arenibacter sp.]|nr:TolC family protein [Arenibacter sp.]